METKIVQFVVRDNNNFYRLELAKALLHLVEFDFTYFWERCIEAGRVAKKTGRLPQSNVSNAKNIISGIHPYVEALINDDFSDIVIDCIIEYICHSERIGLEELWVRCISPKTVYEQAIFNRISAYKTGKAINQWSNLVKLQEYARNKLAFIYDCDEEKTPQPADLLHTRKEYFDLAYSMAANELGIQGEKLPSVRVCSPALMPNATFMNARVSKAIYRRFAEALKLGGDLSVSEAKSCDYIRDRMAMEAYSYVRGMKRPAEMDMKFALEALKDNAFEVYMPDSLKAVIDLEFDLIMKNNIVMRKCEGCGRYFVAVDDCFYCSRVNRTGKTCRSQYETMHSRVAENAVDKINDNKEKALAEDNRQILNSTKSTLDYSELEKRSQKIYNALYKRVGKAVDENEFREWSRYLSDMKRNIKTGEATLEQMSEFLDYSDRLCDEVKAVGKSKNSVKPEFNYLEDIVKDNNKDKVDAVSDNSYKIKTDTVIMADSDPDMAHIHVPLKEEVPIMKANAPVKIVSADEVDIKPFKPETFDSLFDAFMAEHTVRDDEMSNDASPEKPAARAIEVKAPQWKRMTREEAYALQEDDKL